MHVHVYVYIYIYICACAYAPACACADAYPYAFAIAYEYACECAYTCGDAYACACACACACSYALRPVDRIALRRIAPRRVASVATRDCLCQVTKDKNATAKSSQNKQGRKTQVEITTNDPAPCPNTYF